jgi:peroxiredoxin
MGWFKKRQAMLEAGSQSPEFELKDTSGAPRSLTAILERGPALFAFFKIGCPVCQLTFPFLERLAKNESVQVIGISQDDSGATQAFNQRFGVTFPVLLDESKACYPVSNAFGITNVPTMFVVEPGGAISTAFTGFSKRDLEGIGQRVGVPPFRPDENVPEWKAG